MGEVDEYLGGLEEPARGILSGIAAHARELVPAAEDGMSYGMAALLYRGRPLMSLVERKRHLALYPFSGRVVSAVAADLGGFSLSSGAIRFSAEQPLPAEVVRRIVELRRAEIDAALDG